MSFTEFPSRLLEDAVNEFASLPGVGRKTAFRLVMNLLRTDTEICNICNDEKRERTLVCVVENIQDVMAIENTRQFRGLYHVLGGIISPVDGIGPSDITINKLEERVREGGIGEVIMALSTTMEGDTTNFYIYRRLSQYDIKVTTLARGVAIGDVLEYTDEITLGQSIVNRRLFSVAPRP